MRRRRAAWLASLAVLSLAGEGCGDRAAPPAPDVAARIGETEEVRYSEFESYLESTVGDGESVLASDVLSQLLDQFLDERLLVRLAVDRGLIRSGEGRGARRRAIDALLREGLREEPSQAEVESWYRRNRQELARPERVRLRQILTEDRATADRALGEIQAGADFAEVARRLSREPGAASGGYQGELSREDLPPAFADVIFGLKPGEVSPVVPADYGFHVFQVLDRAPAEVVPLEQVREEILGRLRRERADRLLARLVTEARGRYNVVVHTRNLPFDYVGSYR
jgi:peptidyl-prolyl cis-trans isomerase C